MKLIMGLLVAGMVVMPGLAAADEAHAAGNAPASKEAEKAATVYTCPMHPEVNEGKPGACPTCGMALEPVKEKTAYVCPMCGVEEAKAGACPKCGMALEERKA